MATTNPDDILEQLKDVGALGGPAKAPPIPTTTVMEVDIERGTPSAEVRDLRGPQTVAALDSLLRHVEGATRHLEGMKGALLELRATWGPVGEGVDVLEALETAETAVAASGAPEVPSASAEPQGVPSGPVEPGGDDYERARQAALRKIRGEDAPQGASDDEENVPFVGQVRALPVGQEPEEVTIGTVGRQKPSFPVEG